MKQARAFRSPETRSRFVPAVVEALPERTLAPVLCDRSPPAAARGTG